MLLKDADHFRKASTFWGYIEMFSRYDRDKLYLNMTGRGFY